MALDAARDAGLLEDIDPAPAYRESIADLVNLGAIRAAGLNVLADAMHGAGAGFIPGMLKGGDHHRHGTAIRGEPVVSRHGAAGAHRAQPERTLPARAGGRSVGGPRPGRGRGPHRPGGRERAVRQHAGGILPAGPFTCWSAGIAGALVKGVTASVMLNKLAQRYSVDIAEMPVGFKNIGPRFVADDALLGGEESGRLRLSRPHPGAGRHPERVAAAGVHGHRRPDRVRHGAPPV